MPDPAEPVEEAPGVSGSPGRHRPERVQSEPANPQEPASSTDGGGDTDGPDAPELGAQQSGLDAQPEQPEPAPDGHPEGEPSPDAGRAETDDQDAADEPEVANESEPANQSEPAPDDQPERGAATSEKREKSEPARRDRLSMVLLGLGETLITLGLIVGLFIVYELWVTNIFSDQKQAKAHSQLVQEWAQGNDPLANKASLPDNKASSIPIGSAFAVLYIPRLGPSYRFAIVEGTDDASLEKGPGHYVGTALPGMVGNFAVAGHRVGKGEPFLNLDQLRPGDPIVVETKTNWYVYRVLGDATTGDLSATGADGIPGREIVGPNQVSVVAPVPDHPEATPTAAYVTLTTCHPKFTATSRMVIHGKLTRVVPQNGDKLPKELAGGTL